MTVEWTITKEYQDSQAARAFSSLDEVFALEGDAVAWDGESAIFPIRIGEVRYYVKRYHKTKGLRSYLGASRIASEWRNQLMFLKLGLPAAKVVAYGQQRLLSKTQRGALVTEALENTSDLEKLVREQSPLLEDGRWVRRVVSQIARITQTLHGHSFAHNDLKWRNILVTQSLESPQVYLIDCPAGQKWFWPLLEYRIIKDLACLDKVAKYQLSRTQRLRFYYAYTGRTRLSISDKQRIQKVLKFFRGRE